MNVYSVRQASLHGMRQSRSAPRDFDIDGVTQGEHALSFVTNLNTKIGIVLAVNLNHLRLSI
jgi:hypothetical protein